MRIESVSHLEPQHLWRRFDEIRRIPRPSKDEARIRDYVLDFAAAHDCPTCMDAAGNVVIRVPASPGYENAPTVVLQGHLDMVCVKAPDKDFDFATDPIELRLEGDRLTADGTTLGADNGIAVAAGLGLITDPSVVHGPLELLFTVDEETGLNGAAALDPTLVSGRRLINLDAEEEGCLIVGCAGAQGTLLRVPVERLPAPQEEAYRFHLHGGAGGHSGVDIHLGRANAIQLLGQIVAEMPGAAVAHFAGGVTRNALPPEAEAIVFATPAAVEKAQALARKLCDQYRATDRNLRLTVDRLDGEAPAEVFSAATTGALLALLRDLPHGVLAMSATLPDLVETSNNLALVATEAEAVVIENTSRSMVMEGLTLAAGHIEAAGRRHGASTEVLSGYPGWAPDTGSPLLTVAIASYRDLHGEEPRVSAIHAGLECGLIGQKIPGMEMVALGPNIRNPHSPYEEVEVSSVKRVLGDYLGDILGRLAREG
jgi:dipeptidase D